MVRIEIALSMIMILAMLSGCIGDSELKQQIVSLNSTVNELVKIKENLEKEKTDLKNENSKLRKELSQCKNTIEELEQNYTALENKYDDLYAEWYDLKSARLRVLDFNYMQLPSVDPVTLDCYDNSILAKFRLNNTGKVSATDIRIRLGITVGNLKYFSEIQHYDKMPPGDIIYRKDEAIKQLKIRTEPSEDLCDRIPQELNSTTLYISYEDLTGMIKGILYRVDKSGEVTIEDDYKSFADVFEESEETE